MSKKLEFLTQNKVYWIKYIIRMNHLCFPRKKYIFEYIFEWSKVAN